MTERDEQQIVASLKALALETAYAQAPPELEAALRKAYWRRRRTVLWRRTAVAGAIAASLTAIAVWFSLRWPSAPPEGPRIVQAPVIRPETRAETNVAVTKPRPRVRRTTPVVRPQVVSEEIATGFLPVAGGDVFAPLDRGRVVRVRMPRSALAVFGLPVNEDRIADSVRADVLLGEDGMARAIRFVR